MAVNYNTGYMSSVSYQNIGGPLDDWASSFHWDIKFTRFPSAVYYPGDDIFRNRILNCTPPDTSAISLLEEKVQGFTNIQSGDVDRSGDLSIEFQDTVDQSIQYLFLDWQNNIQDPETRQGLKKNQLICNLDLYQLDRALQPIKKWECKTGMLQQIATSEQYTGENSNLGKIQVTIRFEQVVPKILNV